MRYEYQLISIDNPMRMAGEVTKALSERWELWGNPFAAHESYGETYCQAMIRLVEDADAGKQEQAAGYVVETPTIPAEECSCFEKAGDNADCLLHQWLPVANSLDESFQP
jgi:hypothetical protein